MPGLPEKRREGGTQVAVPCALAFGLTFVV